MSGNNAAGGAHLPCHHPPTPASSAGTLAYGEVGVLAQLRAVVMTREQYDHLFPTALPQLVEYATMQTRRLLRQLGQWDDDVPHQKFAARCGYEFVERFLTTARPELPCRPLWYLDSAIAQCFSRPDPFRHREVPICPVDRFVDALMARAVVSRSALMLLFYHLYGLSPAQTVKFLGLSAHESSRVYKSWDRWRQSGWHRAIKEGGFTEAEVQELEFQQLRAPDEFQQRASRVIGMAQAHYRKSEPEYFVCLSDRQWDHLLADGYGYDYRLWHLALCEQCAQYVYRRHVHGDNPNIQFMMCIRPLGNTRLG